MDRRCRGCGESLTDVQVRCQWCGFPNPVPSPVSIVYANPHRMYDDAEVDKYHGRILSPDTRVVPKRVREEPKNTDEPFVTPEVVRPKPDEVSIKQVTVNLEPDIGIIEDEHPANDLTETVDTTYRMHVQGKSIEEIAMLRALSSITVYRHMIELVQSGFIEVEDLLPKERINEVAEVVKRDQYSTLKDIKEQVSDEISYSQIKLIMASLGKYEPILKYSGKSGGDDKKVTIAPDKSDIGLTILQCVDDLDYPIGRKILMMVLHGSNVKKIIQGGFPRSKYYSALYEFTGSEISDLIDQLLDQEYLEIQMLDNKFNIPLLFLTNNGKQALGRSEQIILKLPEKTPMIPRKPKPVSMEELNNGEKILYQELAAWRLKCSREFHLPAFVIFHNTTLWNIARHQPKTINDLMRVPGIGRYKCEQYGDDVLRIIESYHNARNESPEDESPSMIEMKISIMRHGIKEVVHLIAAERIADAEIRLGELVGQLKGLD